MSKSTPAELEGSATTDEQFPAAIGVDADGRVHCHDEWADEIKIYAAPHDIVQTVACPEHAIDQYVAHVEAVAGWAAEWHDQDLSAAQEARRVAEARR